MTNQTAHQTKTQRDPEQESIKAELLATRRMLIKAALDVAMPTCRVHISRNYLAESRKLDRSLTYLVKVKVPSLRAQVRAQEEFASIFGIEYLEVHLDQISAELDQFTRTLHTQLSELKIVRDAAKSELKQLK